MSTTPPLSDHTPKDTTAKPTLRWYQFGRGTIWILVALIGAVYIGPHLGDLGINEYGQRWLGSCFKVASAAWGGFRVSRDICRIDPSSTTEPVPFALLHLARALLVGLTILGVCLAV